MAGVDRHAKKRRSPRKANSLGQKDTQKIIFRARKSAILKFRDIIMRENFYPINTLRNYARQKIYLFLRSNIKIFLENLFERKKNHEPRNGSP